MLRAGYGSIKKKALIPPHPLTNFEIKEYYENKPTFNSIYSRDNLPKNIKNGACVINLDEYADVGTHWIALYVKNNEVIYFDSFGFEHVLKKSKDLLGIKISKQTHIEYKQTIRLCVDTSASDLSILYLQEKVSKK